MRLSRLLRSVGLCLAGGASLAIAAEPGPQFEQNWPNWRGPLSNGVAVHADPPTTWGEKENVRWKVPVPGKGSATPIIWEDKVILLTVIDTGKEMTTGGTLQRRGRPETPQTVHQFCAICYDRKTGQEQWRYVCAEEVPHEPGHITNTLASGSPITDGQFLYISFGSYGIYCLDLDGKPVWKTDLGDMQTRNGFGEGSSPALYGDTLVVPWDHEGQSYLFALDAKSGDIRWKIERDEPTTWMTPFIVEHAGRVQVITNGTNRSRSNDLKTGELIWECGGQFTNPIPSPLVKDDLVYCMTGYKGYAVYAIPLSSQGDITDSDQIRWKRNDAGPYIASPVLYENRLYFTKSREAILYSVDATTGETRIEAARMPGLSTLYASPVVAKNRLYFTDRTGKTLVLQHGDELKVLASNQLDDAIDASPALVGSQMFLRSASHLYCIEESAGGK